MYNFHLEIKFLDNEYWWGGAVDEGIFMPYINNYPLADLNDNNFGNQATSFFISSKGRYFYSDEPIRYEIQHYSALYIALTFFWINARVITFSGRRGNITDSTAKSTLLPTSLTPSFSAFSESSLCIFTATNAPAKGTKQASAHIRALLPLPISSLTDLSRNATQINPNMKPERIERPT